MNAARAMEMVEKFSSCRMLVIGDAMLDRYVSGSVERISPEAPVPVVLVEHEESRPGGAANVALNIQAMGAQAVMGGIVGADAAGNELLELLSKQNIDVSGSLQHASVVTTVKTRVLAGRQQVVRVDRESRGPVQASVLSEFRKLAVDCLGRVQGLVVEDYGKGLIDQALVDDVVSRCVRKGLPVGFDPKQFRHLSFEQLTLASPNLMEACEAASLPYHEIVGDPLQDPALGRISDILKQRWGCENLMITLGPKGMYLSSRSGAPLHMDTRAREVYDVSGAGDTVISAAMLSLAAGADLELAAYIANHAAGVVVGQVGTAPCTREELLTSLSEE